MVTSETHRNGTGAADPAHPNDVSFRSILFSDGRPVDEDVHERPDVLRDLNLDRIVDALTAKREAYDLLPFLQAPLRTVEEVEYRQQVLAELANDELAASVQRFTARLREMRDNLMQAHRLRYRYQRAASVLEAVEQYGAAVHDLAADLDRHAPSASGWQGLRDYLAAYITTDGYRALRAESRDMRERLTRLSYCVRIAGGTVTVTPLEGQDDYSAEVAATFAKFRQGKTRTHRLKFATSVEMNHVEAQVLDGVARLDPELFAQLGSFPERHHGFPDEVILRFDREVQLFLAYRELVAPLQSAGLPFCTPRLGPNERDVHAEGTFDLALAVQLVEQGGVIVRNDISLTGGERILVVTGPNQGGKTTYARAFGQLHYLAALGLSVPGTVVRLPLADQVLTQFERGENMADLSGKLADDLTRMRGILEQATEHSVVVLNELFSSTTLEDARLLGGRVLEQLIERRCLGVYVTFVEELAALGPAVISMVSTVDSEDPTRRTFKVVRRPADGRAYADVLAEKYGLTAEALAARIAS